MYIIQCFHYIVTGIVGTLKKQHKETLQPLSLLGVLRMVLPKIFHGHSYLKIFNSFPNYQI